MSLLLQIVHNRAGTWTVQGLPTRPVARLGSLAESIEYARRESHASPAAIELMVDGFYAVLHQEQGWPQQRLAAGNVRHSLPTQEARPEKRSIATRCRDWLRQRRF
jgi:hypothetical protein